jgi:hypothetical protein
MARKESKKWLKVIDELHSINTPSSGAASRQRLELVWSLLEQLEATPALPRTTWETLVTTTQVGFTCCMSAGKAHCLQLALHMPIDLDLGAPSMDCMDCSCCHLGK